MKEKHFDLGDFQKRLLPSENDIIAKWGGSLDTPIVSILCITYNQKEYIEDAFRGFLFQKTEFPFEVVVHDDASTDGTTEIIQTYVKRYPKIFKPIIQTENQYSQGRRPVSLAFKYMRGEFVAFCEADDFWIDDLKLTKQVSAMAEYEDIDVAFHRAVLTDSDGRERMIGHYADAASIISPSEIIQKKYRMIPTASTLIRSSALKEAVNFMLERPWLTVGDVYIHFFGCIRGGAFFDEAPMSVYQRNNSGSWSANSKKDFEKRLGHVDVRIRSYKDLNLLTKGAFMRDIKNANSKSVVKLLMNEQIPYFRRLALVWQYRTDVRANALIYVPVLFFPVLVRLARHLKKHSRHFGFINN